jgi:hypothetical protein
MIKHVRFRDRGLFYHEDGNTRFFLKVGNYPQTAQRFVTEDCHTGVQGHEKLVFHTIKFASCILNEAITQNYISGKLRYILSEIGNMGCDMDTFDNGYVMLYRPVDYWQPMYGSVTPLAGESASDSAEQVTS